MRKFNTSAVSSLALFALPIALADNSVAAAPAKALPVPALFAGADLRLGEKLIADNQCVACHQRKVGGDGSAVYKPTGRINSLGALRGMVEYCNTELNLTLFPDEVTAISAVLNRDHYRFR